MNSKKHVGYVDTKNSSSDIMVRFCDEMMGLFCYEIGSEFEVCRCGIDMVCVRYPLTNTYFIIQFIKDLSCWRIVDGNCKNMISYTQKFDLSDCVRYIRLNRYGRSMPAYFSYAVS